MGIFSFCDRQEITPVVRYYSALSIQLFRMIGEARWWRKRYANTQLAEHKHYEALFTHRYKINDQARYG